MENLKIKIGSTEISMSNGMLATLVIAIVSGILMLFGVVSPIEIWTWLLKAWNEVMSVVRK